jgi:uncharacterized membrane protein YhaH (DUF805 family)
MDWYLETLNKYADFGGRARRREYWMFHLINFIISVAVGFAAGLVGGMLGLNQTLVTGIALLYSVAMFIPSLAVWVRRLHDTGRSGWWSLIVLIPLIGAVVLLVWAVQDSEPGSNTYGKNPKTSFA